MNTVLEILEIIFFSTIALIRSLITVLFSTIRVVLGVIFNVLVETPFGWILTAGSFILIAIYMFKVL